MKLGPGGSINLVGKVQSSPSDPTYPYGLLLGRLSADGAADPAFGPDGTGLAVNRELLIGDYWSLSVDAAGNLVVGAIVGSPVRGVVARYTGS